MFRRKLAEEKAEKSQKFNKKHLWWIIPLAGVFCLVIVQIFWPKDWSRPLYKFGDSIGVFSKDDILGRLQNISSEAKMAFGLNGEVERFSFSEIGATIDGEESLARFFEYSFLERLTPFSLFRSGEFGRMKIKFSDLELKKFTNEYVAKHNKSPKNATIELSNSGEVIVKDAVDGIEISADSLRASLLSQQKAVDKENYIAVTHKLLKASRQGSDYTAVKTLAEKLLNRKAIFIHEHKIYTPAKDQVASWISFKESEGGIELVVNDENFKKYIDSINGELEIPAVKTVVNIIDGREVSREAGKSGSRVSLQKMKADLEKYLNEEIFYPEFILEFEPVEPTEQKNYSYTNTQEGLQAKVNEIGSRYNVRISLKQLNGAGWEANYREKESTPSASTYKLYVALKLFDEMNKGNINWESNILGTTTKDCFYQMIVVSTNRCAEEWIRMFGRQNLNNFIHGLGISGITTFMASDAARTSALDLRNVVEGIYSGRLASGNNRDTLLHFMDIQKYPYGIPKGTKGRVFDKVGFLWDYVHDTGIVEHPRGTYVVAIMTKGSGGYATIAQITRELEAFMYP